MTDPAPPTDEEGYSKEFLSGLQQIGAPPPSSMADDEARAEVIARGKVGKAFWQNLLVSLGTTFLCLLLADLITDPRTSERTQHVMVFLCLFGIVALLRWESVSPAGGLTPPGAQAEGYARRLQEPGAPPTAHDYGTMGGGHHAHDTLASD